MFLYPTPALLQCVSLVTWSFSTCDDLRTTERMTNQLNTTSNRQMVLANLTTVVVGEKVDSKDGETRDAPLWERIGQNWQVVGLRLIFIFAALCVGTMVFCCCCQIALTACCFNLKEGCRPCGPVFDILSTFYEDPMYKKAKRTAELFGLKLDYKTYMKIKETHINGQTDVYNPLGLPWMEA